MLAEWPAEHTTPSPTSAEQLRLIYQGSELIVRVSLPSYRPYPTGYLLITPISQVVTCLSPLSGKFVDDSQMLNEVARYGEM